MRSGAVMGGMKDSLLGDRLYAPTYPDIPGFRGPTNGPSALAAKSVKGRAERIRADVLSLLEHTTGGLTVDEILARLDVDRVYGQPRISELRRQGRIVASGIRRRSAYGATSTVWILAPPETVRTSGGEPR